jgi:pyruvoyl-dependent arginine decarboxylase (PvlArgDC)
MARVTIKIDSEVHAAAINICVKSGKGLIDYLTEAVQEKNEREMQDIVKRLQEKHENRESFTAYILSVLNYNAEKAKRERDEFLELHKSVFI